jgi:hypothetical protein
LTFSEAALRPPPRLRADAAFKEFILPYGEGKGKYEYANMNFQNLKKPIDNARRGMYNQGKANNWHCIYDNYVI